MKVLERLIWVTGQFRALHRWKDCPIEEVAFLKNWHRHVFKVKVILSVTHSDRDLEFFVVQRQLNWILKEYEDKEIDMSCEMFAEDICNKLALLCSKITSIEVSEDGENGAIVFFEKPVIIDKFHDA